MDQNFSRWWNLGKIILGQKFHFWFFVVILQLFVMLNPPTTTMPLTTVYSAFVELDRAVFYEL